MKRFDFEYRLQDLIGEARAVLPTDEIYGIMEEEIQGLREIMRQEDEGLLGEQIDE